MQSKRDLRNYYIDDGTRCVIKGYMVCYIMVSRKMVKFVKIEECIWLKNIVVFTVTCPEKMGR